ncbi:XRE family transcriptional regulator [Haloechinothrix salitolerans]|uniref:XRE family transcriptional regulator n=1 Tax=Haloechinothrix salitolerans TaxID=926830 RepID=A0ABW2C8C2_9PSEU
MSHVELDAADIAALFDRNRLRIARELRGLTQVELARETGSVTSASVSQFENGHTRPSGATLRRLSVALRVPLSFFAAPARPPQPGGATGFFRSLRSTSPRDRHQALAYVQLARELALEVEKFVALPELDLPRVQPPVTEETDSAEIETLAQETRKHWGIPPGPINDVIRTVERHGIITVRFLVGLEKVDAFSVNFPDRPIIALSADKNSRDRSRFDAAHELGHLVMHGNEQAGTKQTEDQAHAFASAFLMPADDIRDELPSRADWPTLLYLKEKWHASIASLIVRARRLNVMDEKAYTQAWKALSARGWRKKEPGNLGKPEAPVLLRRALDVAEEYGILFTKILEQGGLPENDIRIILDRPEDRPRVEI